MFSGGFAHLNAARCRHERTKCISKPVGIRIRVHGVAAYFGNEISAGHDVSATGTDQYGPPVGVQVGGHRIWIGDQAASCAAVECVNQIFSTSG